MSSSHVKEEMVVSNKAEEQKARDDEDIGEATATNLGHPGEETFHHHPGASSV